MQNLFHLQWHITNMCNLRCSHCYQDNFSNTEELDLEGLITISENIKDTLKKWNRMASINLTGGEPIIKPGLLELLQYLDKNSMVSELGIITNGILLNEEMIRRFSSIPKLRRIKVSLDGATQKTNDSIRGDKSFNEVIKNLSTIIKKCDLEITLMFTVMRRNLKELPYFFELSKNLGVNGFIIERFIPLGRGSKIRSEVLTKEDWKSLIQMLSDIFNIEQQDLLITFQAFQIIFNDEGFELLGAPCVIGRDGLCIMPRGDVFPCRRFPISIGSLLENSLHEIWEGSELLKSLKDKINLKGKCKNCNIENCFGCRSLALSLNGDPLAEDPNCFYEF